MDLFKTSLKITTLFLAFSLGIAPTFATNKITQKGNKKKTNTSYLTPKSVKLKQSQDNIIEITTNQGNTASLPKVDKLLVENTKAAISLNNPLLINNDDISMTALREKLAEQKEIEELSKILGVKIKDNQYLDLYREVADWLGTRYQRGGMSRTSVDCSGFTNLIYNTVFDKKLPRVSTQIAKDVKESVAKDKLEPGDLVFFSTFGKKYINHVGVYIGDGHFVHASIKKGVIVSTLSEGYYSKVWRKGGRF